MAYTVGFTQHHGKDPTTPSTICANVLKRSLRAHAKTAAHWANAGPEPIRGTCIRAAIIVWTSQRIAEVRPRHEY